MAHRTFKSIATIEWECNGLTKCELQNPLYNIRTSIESWV